ncbi:MAG: hypothetical protein U1F15_13730 [Burkholderiales bacterium]
MDATELDRRLAALRDATAGALPPPATDHAIAAAVAGARRAAPPRRHRWLAWPLALAASITALSFVVRSLPPEAVVGAPAAPDAATAGFLPIAPLADIESAGDTWVVPARLPRTTLAQLGLPVDPARADEGVDAELLVRRDGSVLAVRFVR